MEESCKDEMDGGKRAFRRITKEDICYLHDYKNILVEIGTGAFTITGFIKDVSAGGLAFTSDTFFDLHHEITVNFRLGNRLIKSNGVVRHISSVGKVHETGIMFENLGEDHVQYIKSVTCINNVLSNMDIRFWKIPIYAYR